VRNGRIDWFQWFIVVLLWAIYIGGTVFGIWSFHSSFTQGMALGMDIVITLSLFTQVMQHKLNKAIAKRKTEDVKVTGEVL
jgi:hypothetical protein